MAQKVTSTDIKLALKEFHNGKMDPIDLELVIKDASRLLTRLQAMQVQEEQDDKS